MPSTGRELSRQLRIRPYSTAQLFQPQVNLQLGTQYYLRSVADSVDGRREAALAAYNAGLGRAKDWSTWASPARPRSSSRLCLSRRRVSIFRLFCATRISTVSCKGAPESAAVKSPAVPASRVSYSDGIDQRTKSSRHRRTLKAARASAVPALQPTKGHGEMTRLSRFSTTPSIWRKVIPISLPQRF